MSQIETITRDALNRLEGNVRRELDALKQLTEQRFKEHDRRLSELNNAHDRAIQEKQRTDQAALQVQERSVTKAELQTWKDEVNRALNLAQGAATARATMLSVAVGIVVLLINLAIRLFSK